MNPTQPTHNTTTRHLLTIFCLLFGLLWSLQAHAGNRVALIIGNSKYQQGALANPGDDADDIAAKLLAVGFDKQDIRVVKDLNKRQILREFRDFSKRIYRSTEVALVFYSGHGAQFRQQSYLIPLSAQLQYDDDLPIEAVNAQDVLSQIESRGAKVNVMVLDACRNLPFTVTSESKSTVSIRGLSKMNSEGSTLIAYATAPNQVAADGGRNGRNSPYTEMLLAHLDKPGLTLTELFNDVGVAVKQTYGQEPWVSSAPLPKIYLAGQAKPVKPSQPTSSIAKPDSTKPTHTTATTIPPRGVTKVSAATIKQLRQHLDNLGCYQQLKKQDGKWGWRDKYALKQLLQKNSNLQGVVGNEPGEQWLDVMKELDIQSCKNVATQANPSKPTPSKPTAVKPSVPKPSTAQPPVAQKPATQPSKPTADISPQPPKVNQVNPAEIKRKLQVQLNRLNCNAGGADGKWGSKSKAALNRLRNANSGLKAYGTSPTEKLLQAIQNRNWQRCPEVVVSKPSPSTISTSTPSSGKRISHYTVYNNGTAKDRRTGLIWQRCSYGQTWNGSGCSGTPKKMTWHKAMKLNKNGWRVPTINQLGTIVYCSSGKTKGVYENVTSDGCAGNYRRPTINTRVFPSTENNFYWSSSPKADGSNYAWGVDLYGGNGYRNSKNDSRYVRLVRGGQ